MPVLASLSTGRIEFKLLCLVARPELDLGGAREILRAGVDFAELFRLGEYHGVRPQLVESLYRMSWETVPAVTRTSVENFRRVHGAHSLFVCQELCRLYEAFAKAGLRFATFKGPTLSALLHGDVSRREYVDVDIIVPKQQIYTSMKDLSDSERAAASKLKTEEERNWALRIQSGARLQKIGCVPAKGAAGFVCEYREGRHWPDGRVQYLPPDKARFFKSAMGIWHVEFPKS